MLHALPKYHTHSPVTLITILWSGDYYFPHFTKEILKAGKVTEIKWLAQKGVGQNWKENLYPCVGCSVISNSKIQNQFEVFTNRWMNKENIIMKYDICFGYYSVSKEILPFATTYMNLEDTVLISKVPKCKYSIVSTYVNLTELNLWK